MKHLPLAALLLLVVVGGLFWYQSYAGNKEFARNYIVALYGVTSGVQMNVKLAGERTQAWQETGSVMAPRIPSNERQRLQKLDSAVGEAFKKLPADQSRYAVERQKLEKLYDIYRRAYELNLSKPGSVTALTGKLAQLETDFSGAATEMKGRWPALLERELKDSLPKYRNLSIYR